MRPVGSLANGMPQTAMALAALRLAIQEMQEAVEAVARDVADLRRIAETAEIGNLAGVYRVLANAAVRWTRAGSITQATWDSIAPHEVTVQQSADRLRALLRRTLEDLPLEADTGERYAAARRLLDEQTIGRSLKLLVLAEQCRLLWRSLKLDQVRRSEPEALAGEADAAKAMLADNAHADQALIAGLHAALVALGKVGPLDGVRVFTKGKLPAAVADLREQVNQFASQREQQLDSWGRRTRRRRSATRRDRLVLSPSRLRSRASGSSARSSLGSAANFRAARSRILNRNGGTCSGMRAGRRVQLAMFGRSVAGDERSLSELQRAIRLEAAAESRIRQAPERDTPRMALYPRPRVKALGAVSGQGAR